MNAVEPYDWAEFLRTRIDTVQPHAPLGGIQNSGWKLVYNSTRSDMFRIDEEERKHYDLSYSIGLIVRDDGSIQDVSMGGPAQNSRHRA